MHKMMQQPLQYEKKKQCNKMEHYSVMNSAMALALQ